MLAVCNPLTRTPDNDMTDIPDSDHLKHPPSKDVQGKKEMELFMKEIKKQHQDMLNAIKRKNQEIRTWNTCHNFPPKWMRRLSSSRNHDFVP